MSNPFNNVKVQDAREYLKKKSNISKFQSLKGKRENFLNTGIIRNNKLSHINGHSNLLEFSKGYYLTKSCCYDKRGTAHDITDGRYTYFDFKDIKVQHDSSKGCGCKIIENYDFDKCRIKKGLTAYDSKINPIFKTKMFKIHKTNSMIIKPNDCDIKYKNNTKPPLVHNVYGGLRHKHHFPTNTEDLTYFHKHGGNGVQCPKFHCPYPHPAQKTNHYYLAKNYSSDDMLGLEKPVKVKKYYPPPGTKFAKDCCSSSMPRHSMPSWHRSLNFGKKKDCGCN